MSANTNYSVMVHGGAGALNAVSDPKTAVRYLEAVRGVLEHGRDVLELGGSALQAAEACASLLEDDPVFNAGCGSVLNEQGRVEMDAAIMDGRDLRVGAVAAVEGIANPVQLARHVLSERDLVMLVGQGAVQFAEQRGMQRMPDSYFRTAARVSQQAQVQGTGRRMLDHDDDNHKLGTIGVVARDLDGNLAAATSTGGRVNKPVGRVGDSPVPGAGLFADNATCAVSSTGYGEDFLRTALAKTIADFVDMQGMDAVQATAAGIEYLTRKVQGRGGVIVIDHAGRCASGFTTARMIHGWIEHGGEAVVGF